MMTVAIAQYSRYRYWYIYRGGGLVIINVFFLVVFLLIDLPLLHSPLIRRGRILNPLNIASTGVGGVSKEMYECLHGEYWWIVLVYGGWVDIVKRKFLFSWSIFEKKTFFDILISFLISFDILISFLISFWYLLISSPLFLLNRNLRP